VHSLNSHDCGLTYCKFCKLKVPSKDMEFDDDGTKKHQCYIQKIDATKKKSKKGKKRNHGNQLVSDQAQEDAKEECSNDPTYIFFDLECSQEILVKETENGRILQHKILCAHARVVCPKCFDKEDSNCQKCYEKMFTGTNTQNEFCEWLFNHDGPVRAMAHNAQGYDAQFILDWLHNHSMVKPEIIGRGLSLITISVGGVKILDSMAFIPMALAKFPGAFGITNVKKGDFPLRFLTEDNLDYIGPMPEKEKFFLDRLNNKQMEEFDQWYN
jgi:hypothetical protein